MNTNSRPKRSFHLVATVTVVALAGLVVPASSHANNQKVQGVRAAINDGTLEITGSGRADTVALRLEAGDPNRIQVDVGDDGAADRSFARDDVVAIKVKMGDGADSARVDDTNGAFTDKIPTTLVGGDDDDSLNGGLGAETFRGGEGKDRVTGGRGNDNASLGGGADAFRWDPGDASDEIEGQDGRDTMVFNGAPGAETVTMTAAGTRLVFVRQPGNVTMDTDDVESVDFNALGGADSITVNDLTGTDVTRTDLDLAAALGGIAGDGSVDNVVVNGTNGDDAISIDGNGSGADVTGLATAVSVTHADATDVLSVETLAGTDNVVADGVDGVLQVLVDGAPA
jgi:RTX calcium-binding nonapeptide repeat (4 copies)